MNHRKIRLVVIACLILCLLAVPAIAQQAFPSAPVDKPDAQAPASAVEEIEMTCPVDGGKVKGYRIKAFASAGTQRDFCQSYAGRSLYDIWVACSPTSGYCGYEQDFTVSLRAHVKQKVLSEIKPNFDLNNLAPWDKYRITAKIYEWRGKPEIDIANSYLRATYTMRNLPLGPALRQKEQDLRAQAIIYFRKAEKKGQFSLREIATAKYLIGELYRRNEKFGKAVTYFENALKIKNRPDWLDLWANQQMAKALADYAD